MRRSTWIPIIPDRLRRFLSPPVIPDNEYRTFSLRALHYTLLLFMGLLVVFPLFNSSIAELDFLPFIFFLTLCALALTYYFLHTGRYRLASSLFIGGTWLIITFVAFSFNGIRNTNINFYALVIIYSAVLFSPRAAILTTMLSILSSIVLVFGEAQGVLPLQTTAPFLADRFFQVVGLFGSAGILLAAASRATRASYARIRQDEQTLRESEERFKALVANSSDIITVLDSTGIIAFESQSVKRLLGHDPGALVGKNCFDYIHPDDLPVLTALFAENAHQPGATATVEYRFRHVDGSWVYLDSQATNLLDEPVIHGIVVNSRDVTERKQAEERLRASQEELRQLSDAAWEGIVISDEGRMILINRPLAAMFGYATDLRSATQGRASHTPLQFARYQPVPSQIAEEIIAKSGGRAA